MNINKIQYLIEWNKTEAINHQKFHPSDKEYINNHLATADILSKLISRMLLTEDNYLVGLGDIIYRIVPDRYSYIEEYKIESGCDIFGCGIFAYKDNATKDIPNNKQLQELLDCTKDNKK